MATTTPAEDAGGRSRRRQKGRRGAMARSSVKAEPMSLRIDEETRALIDRAADVIGQTRTDFMLASARDRATQVLLNQTFFALPREDWHAFVNALDNPPPPNAKLKALLRRMMPWEKGK
jgi:uncharacterized protein (DUF1778 family)